VDGGADDFCDAEEVGRSKAAGYPKQAAWGCAESVYCFAWL